MFSTCLRFSIFGVTMLWHFLFQRAGRVNETEEIVCFASHISGVKTTRGTLSKQDEIHLQVQTAPFCMNNRLS